MFQIGAETDELGGLAAPTCIIVDVHIPGMSTRPRVLLVDDYPDIVTAVSRLLERDCEVVGTVADGSVLLETVQRLQPEVVVLDMNLPNIHTLEACREIARVHPAMKVVMFSAMHDPDAVQAFVEAGASAFVSKLASRDLLPTIKRVCADRS